MRTRKQIPENMNYLPWSDDEIDILRSLRKGHTNAEISRVLTTLGYPRTTAMVEKKAKREKLKYVKQDTFSPTDNMSDMEDSKLQIALDQVYLLRTPLPGILAKPELSRRQTQTIVSNLQQQMLESLQTILKQAPAKLPRITKLPASGKESLVILLSDLHFGKVVKDIYGNVLFNLDIAKQRLAEIPSKIVEKLGSRVGNIDEVVLIVDGDTVDGEGIYPSQAHHIEVDVLDQVRTTSSSIWGVVQGLLQIRTIERVRIFTCPGNHGRTSYQHSERSNWDNVVSVMLEIMVRMSKDPRLSIENSFGDYNIAEIKGWKGLIRHEAPPGDTSGARNKLGGWHEIHDYDWLASGHFHNPGLLDYQNKPLFRNGSLSGFDDYAERFSFHNEACQLYWLVSEEELMAGFFKLTWEK